MYKTIVCDLDGVLCSEEKTFERAFAQPIKSEIEALNRLHDIGHVVLIHTARSWAEFLITSKQLKELGVRYHTLICGKPVADIVIDDRSVTSVAEALEKLNLKK
jgi:hydroxymethylpyrimidine pyrophosphatase-like HAD family hydrolase